MIVLYVLLEFSLDQEVCVCYNGHEQKIDVILVGLFAEPRRTLFFTNQFDQFDNDGFVIVSE